MKKKIFSIICAGAIFAACENAEQQTYYVDDLVLDTEHCIAEGSYVQGVALAQDCKVVLRYENASGGTAEFSAPASNGMRIDAQTVQLAKGSGSVDLKVSGTPLELKLTYLQINVKYNGATYISSVEINVLEDLDPSGVIVFSVDGTSVLSLQDAVTVAFTVTPTMAAVSATAPEGLRVSIASDKSTGEGTITLTPSANYLSGDVTLTASFGAREAQKQTIATSAFSAGDGTAASPWIVSNEKTLDKLRYGTDKAFRLSSDISVASAWNPVGTAASPFNGSLDGAGHSIDFSISTSDSHAAFFGYVGASATVNSLVLKGSVEGGDYVAALAASSEAAISADVSGVSVLGDNHIAEKIASGSAKDARTIIFGEIPARVNITAIATEYVGEIGLLGGDADVVFDAGSTGLNCSFDKTTGNATFAKTPSFVPGDISFYAKLSDKVRSRSHVIGVTSKNMFERGTGTPSDPYVVTDLDQLSATMLTYPASCIFLEENASISGWETLPSFSGTLDGGSHKLSWLKVPFIANLSGTVKNIAFSEVDITAGGTNTGAVANLLSGSLSGVSVKGSITATSANSGDTGLSALVGQAEGSASITDCYSGVEISVSGTNFATGGVVGVIKSSGGITIQNCTVEGAINITSGATKVGGILGRKTNASQSSKDIIADCLVAAAINVSGSSSNMIGGVFGALQGSTPSGDYVGGITIVRTAFTGSVSAGTAVGGICGVGCSVTDCFVSGSVQATNNTGSTGGSAGMVAAAKGDVTRCVVAGSRISGTNLSSFSTAGIISKQNGNAPKAVSCAVIGALLQAEGKTILGATANLDGIDNKWWGVKYLDETAYVSGNTVQDGNAFAAAPTQADFEALGYNFSSVWKWNAAGYPELQNPGCPAQVKNM